MAGSNMRRANWRWAQPLAMLAVFCFAFPALCGAQAECAAAKKTYESTCAACHGETGKGNPILKTPDFTDPHWQAARKDPELIDAIANGVKETAMPSFKDQIKPAEIDALVKCVVRGFGKKEAPAAKHTSHSK